jgi:methionine aminotransferase
MKEFQKVHQYNVFSVNHPVQRGIAHYLRDEKHFLELRTFYQEKRDYFLDAIRPSRFRFTPSKGTYFQVLEYSGITDENDIDFSKRLIEEHKIASIPLSVFNHNNEDNKQLRFCFAKKKDTLNRAAEILNKI